MKFIFKIIIVGGLSYLAESILPWWFVVVVAFAVGALMKDSSINAFLAGVLGVGLLWFGAAIFINTTTLSLLPERVADLFQLGSSFVLAAVTGLVGGILGGLGSLSGSYFRKLLVKQDVRSRY